MGKTLKWVGTAAVTTAAYLLGTVAIGRLLGPVLKAALWARLNLPPLTIGPFALPAMQAVQILLGLPLFVFGVLLVAKTTAQNHTAQNKQTRKPEKLLTDGVYAKRRHPMYAGFVCVQASLWFGCFSPIGYLAGTVFITAVVLNSRREETGELEKLFPGDYAGYKKKVPRRMFTPALLAYLLVLLVLAAAGLATMG